MYLKWSGRPGVKAFLASPKTRATQNVKHGTHRIDLCTVALRLRQTMDVKPINCRLRRLVAKANSADIDSPSKSAWTLDSGHMWTRMRREMQLVKPPPPPDANTPANLRGCWIKVHQMFTRRRGVIGGVNAHIRIAILLSFMECQRTEWRWGMPIFADSRQNSEPKRSRKGQIDHARPCPYIFWKFDKYRSSTFWNKVSP